MGRGKERRGEDGERMGRGEERRRGGDGMGEGRGGEEEKRGEENVGMRMGKFCYLRQGRARRRAKQS